MPRLPQGRASTLWPSRTSIHPACAALHLKRMAAAAANADSSSIAAPNPTEFNMFQRTLHRAVSFVLAVVMTAGMLGGIDQLAQPSDAAPQWAQQASSTRA
jgi:hypothetical protein